MNFSLELLDAAKSAFERLERKVIELKKETRKGADKTKEYTQKFTDAINDDLNTPKAIQIVWEILDDKEFDPQKKLHLLIKLDEVLGFGIADMHEAKVTVPAEITSLVKEREQLRKDKKWAESDIVRARIRERGYEVVDTQEGPQIKKSS